MNILSKLSSAQGTKSQEPNKRLSKEICRGNDKEAVRELVENLNNSDKNIQSDCAGMMEYIGFECPELIAKYVDNLIDALASKNNRVVWGVMIALSIIANKRAKIIFERRSEVIHAIESGSVITIDNGVKVLARVASVKKEYSDELFPYLLRLLERCRAKSVPQYAESISVAVNKDNRERFVKVLKKRTKDLKEAWKKRVERVLNG